MRRPILLVAIVSIFVPRLVVAQERPKEELADRVNAHARAPSGPTNVASSSYSARRNRIYR